MEQQTLTKQQLAERWQVHPKTIDDYIKQKIINPIKGLGVIRFSLKHIEEQEGTKMEPFSPLARKQLENKIADLEQENSRYRETFGKIMQDVGQVFNLINK